MEHTPGRELEWSPGAPETFTGRVWSTPLSRDANRTVTVIGVIFEPGHGAAPSSHMMHLSITSGGATEWEQKEVSEQEYSAGTSPP
jgi:hypothetical protein